MPPQVATCTRVPSPGTGTPQTKTAPSAAAEEKLGAHGAKVKHKRRFCRIEGCERIVKSQGLCQRHGAKPRLCKVDGCVKQAQGNFDGMCKSHFKEHKRKTTPIPAVDTSSGTVPEPTGSSVYDGVLPSSVDFFPNLRVPAHARGKMPLVAHLAEGFHGGKPPAWHRNEERKARGLLPVQNPATQLEGWERELVWMEILVLTGVPEVSFRHLARAWGRDKGFHMVLAQFICERHGDVQRKKRKRDEDASTLSHDSSALAAAAAAVAAPRRAAAARRSPPATIVTATKAAAAAAQPQHAEQQSTATTTKPVALTQEEMKAVRVAMLTPERKKQIASLLRRRSSGTGEQMQQQPPLPIENLVDELSYLGADVWDDTCYGDANYNEALAADLFNLTPQESALLKTRLSSGKQHADDDSSAVSGLSRSISVASGKHPGGGKDVLQQVSIMKKRDSSTSLISNISAHNTDSAGAERRAHEAGHAVGAPLEGGPTVASPIPQPPVQQQQLQQQYNGQTSIQASQQLPTSNSRTNSSQLETYQAQHQVAATPQNQPRNFNQQQQQAAPQYQQFEQYEVEGQFDDATGLIQPPRPSEQTRQSSNESSQSQPAPYQQQIAVAVPQEQQQPAFSAAHQPQNQQAQPVAASFGVSSQQTAPQIQQQGGMAPQHTMQPAPQAQQPPHHGMQPAPQVQNQAQLQNYHMQHQHPSQQAPTPAPQVHQPIQQPQPTQPPLQVAQTSPVAQQQSQTLTPAPAQAPRIQQQMPSMQPAPTPAPTPTPAPQQQFNQQAVHPAAQVQQHRQQQHYTVRTPQPQATQPYANQGQHITPQPQQQLQQNANYGQQQSQQLAQTQQQAGSQARQPAVGQNAHGQECGQSGQPIANQSPAATSHSQQGQTAQHKTQPMQYHWYGHQSGQPGAPEHITDQGRHHRQHSQQGYHLHGMPQSYGYYYYPPPVPHPTYPTAGSPVPRTQSHGSTHQYQQQQAQPVQPPQPPGQGYASTPAANPGLQNNQQPQIGTAAKPNHPFQHTHYGQQPQAAPAHQPLRKGQESGSQLQSTQGQVGGAQISKPSPATNNHSKQGLAENKPNLHDYDHRNEHLVPAEENHEDDEDPSHDQHDYGAEVVHEDHDHDHQHANPQVVGFQQVAASDTMHNSQPAYHHASVPHAAADFSQNVAAHSRAPEYQQHGAPSGGQAWHSSASTAAQPQSQHTQPSQQQHPQSAHHPGQHINQLQPSTPAYQTQQQQQNIAPYAATNVATINQQGHQLQNAPQQTAANDPSQFQQQQQYAPQAHQATYQPQAQTQTVVAHQPQHTLVRQSSATQPAEYQQQLVQQHGHSNQGQQPAFSSTQEMMSAFDNEHQQPEQQTPALTAYDGQQVSQQQPQTQGMYPEPSPDDNQAAKNAMNDFAHEHPGKTYTQGQAEHSQATAPDPLHEYEQEALFELPYTTAATAGLQQAGDSGQQAKPQPAFQEVQQTGNYVHQNSNTPAQPSGGEAETNPPAASLNSFGQSQHLQPELPQQGQPQQQSQAYDQQPQQLEQKGAQQGQSLMQQAYQQLQQAQPDSYPQGEAQQHAVVHDQYSQPQQAQPETHQQSQPQQHSVVPEQYSRPQQAQTETLTVQQGQPQQHSTEHGQYSQPQQAQAETMQQQHPPMHGQYTQLQHGQTETVQQGPPQPHDQEVQETGQLQQQSQEQYQQQSQPQFQQQEATQLQQPSQEPLNEEQLQQQYQTVDTQQGQPEQQGQESYSQESYEFAQGQNYAVPGEPQQQEEGEQQYYEEYGNVYMDDEDGDDAAEYI